MTITGWAPPGDVIIGNRSTGYYVVLQHPGGSGDSPWLGQVQQAPDGSLTGSFRVPLAESTLGRLTPGPYTLALQTLLNNAHLSTIRPAPGLIVTPLSKGGSVLGALSPSEIALVSGASPYPLIVSHDGGQTWADVALPSLGTGSGDLSQLSGLQLLPNGALLAHGDSGPGWLLLAAGASRWCTVTGASLPASVTAFWAIGDRLWWVQAASGPNQAPTVGSVAVSALQCGQAIPTRHLTPVATTTGPALAPTAALRVVLDSPGVKGSSLFAMFPTRIRKQPCTIHRSGPAPGSTISGILYHRGPAEGIARRGRLRRGLERQGLPRWEGSRRRLAQPHLDVLRERAGEDRQASRDRQLSAAGGQLNVMIVEWR